MRLFPPDHETIEGVGRAVRDGQRTFVDVLESCLARVEEWEPKVQAWVVLDREGAMGQAREADRERAEGLDRGPLHGVPFGIKDIVDVAGLPTGAGAGRWAEGPAAEDAEIVRRLRRAGAVILGKTVTTPYAWVDPPPTRNPWDLGRTPGGSSSGSAAAVATGMCLGAVGTQTGGSLTRPAAYCGVASHKPGDGLLMARGIVPLAPGLDTPGFLARTVGDLWQIQDALDRLARDDASARGGFRLEESYRDLQEMLRSRGPLGRLRTAELGALAFDPDGPPVLGRVRGFFQDLMEPAARVIHEAALMELQQAGAEIVDVELPEAFGDVHRPHRVLMAAEAAATHDARFGRIPEDYPPRIAALIAEGRSIAAVDYLHAREARRDLCAALDRAIAGVHALIVPAATGPAPDRSTTGDPAFNSPWTFTQSPTLSFPIGLSADGLPLGVQVVGHRLGSPFEVAGWAERAIRERRG